MSIASMVERIAQVPLFGKKMLEKRDGFPAAGPARLFGAPPIAAWSEDGALANAGRRRRRLALQTGTARLIVIVRDVPRRGGRAVLPLN